MDHFKGSLSHTHTEGREEAGVEKETLHEEDRTIKKKMCLILKQVVSGKDRT